MTPAVTTHPPGGNCKVATMSDILDDTLRQQLAAALVGLGGDPGELDFRLSFDTVCSTPRHSFIRHARNHVPSHGSRSASLNKALPPTPPGPGHHHKTPSRGHIRNPSTMDAEENDNGITVVDDIDADSVILDDESHINTPTGLDTSHQPRLRTGSNGESVGPKETLSQGQHLEARNVNAEAPHLGDGKALPPLPVGEIDDPAPASPPPKMSCRISRFPFSHPCDVPELVPDHDEDMSSSAAATSSSSSAPVTPGIPSDALGPGAAPVADLVQIPAPGPLQLSPSLFPEYDDRMRKLSIKTIDTATSARDGGAGVNEDGVSLLTPTEASYDGSFGDQTSHGLRPIMTAKSDVRSVSSLGSVGSGESRQRANPSRKSINLFSRIRSNTHHEEVVCMEHRTLTPVQLLTPPRQADDQIDLPRTSSASGPAPSLVLPPSRGESGSGSRFFRMPWASEAKPKEPAAVFGVDLKESLRVAPMKIRISHKGKSTSYRTFPISVHKCCEFIRNSGETDNNIFSLPGSEQNVANLKSIFSQPPMYGENFQFEGTQYTIHDAARLILVYLQELPKPLIPSSVLKSWIVLARQEGAIEPPCPRIETGLDFWTEALNRLPTAHRNLTKHLLTLWAEVLLKGSDTINEADARQLASAVAGAMFHHDADGSSLDKSKAQRKKPVKRNVQPTLALAFLIRKRGEYLAYLGRASKEPCRNSKMFLPSTKEIMEWKKKGSS